MKKVAVIGAGISGLSVARLLGNRYRVTVFECENLPGGLIRCERIDGNLFHVCGGHVFNSKRKDVLDWFWNHFNQEEEFIKADRNSVVFMEDGKRIPYPIENHAYLFSEDKLKRFIDDLVGISQDSVRKGNCQIRNFEEFLLTRFGSTLYEEYFRPYNEKVWRRNLSEVPISWLEGKLPMPTVAEMIYNNIHHVKEKEFVHSSFWYEKNNGSQHIVDTLSNGLDIRCNFKGKLQFNPSLKNWIVNGEAYDIIIFCGNVKTLLPMLEGIHLEAYGTEVEKLESHGTTSVFCEIEKNPFSWIYMPSRLHEAHRIICTGNFAETNNVGGKMTGTIEFTDFIIQNDILDNLSRIPLSPKYLTHRYNKYTYPIQNMNTREMIKSMKQHMKQYNLYMTGRFADWEYYNMDMAIGAAMDLCENFVG